MLQPLAIAIISGLIVQLPLVLLVLPALLVLFGPTAVRQDVMRIPDASPEISGAV
jgi:Cu/Ag efflux pump CusA